MWGAQPLARQSLARRSSLKGVRHPIAVPQARPGFSYFPATVWLFAPAARGGFNPYTDDTDEL